MKLKEIMSKLEKIYDYGIAEDWDNVGLIVGDEEKEIKKILLCLDVTLEAISEAVKMGVDLIISHHPFIFRGIKKITKSDLQGKKLLEVIENKIAVYSIHTNCDFAEEGLNKFILSKIFSEKNNEIYDKIECENNIRTFTLEKEMDFLQLLEKIKANLRIDYLRYVGERDRIKKVGIVTGAGSSFIDDLGSDVDVFLTGDLKHHESLDALEMGKVLVDIGHYESEYLFVELIEKNLKEFFDGEMIKFYGKAVFRLA